MKLTSALVVLACCAASTAHAALPECAENFECLAQFLPVCGANGVTYSNACELKKAQCKDKTITKKSDGACSADDKPTTTAPPSETTTPTPEVTPTTTAPPSGGDATPTTPTTPFTTTAPPATTTKAPSTGSTGGKEDVNAGSKDSASSPSVPATTTKAPVPSPTNSAPLVAVGVSALAAATIAALL